MFSFGMWELQLLKKNKDKVTFDGKFDLYRHATTMMSSTNDYQLGRQSQWQQSGAQ
jgi:hypothetical protein